MPISHASIIHKPGEYIAPVDLNLLGKVLQFKQAQYDQGVNKVQGAIDSAASLDVARGVDKEYLNSKLTSLVDTVNGLGSMDLSDSNISNQVAGLSSQIHGDNNVINAVAGTKAFRYVQDYYKNLKEKTGTKNAQTWNPANEDFDTGKFSEWFNDQRPGAPLRGDAGKVTPYAAYEQDWQKTFQNIANSANVSTSVNPKGELMYRLDTHTEVSKEQIWSAASKMLSPAQRQQIAIEGRYQFKNVPISELTKMADMVTYNKVGDLKDQQDNYKAKAKMATATEDQEKYNKLISDNQNQIDSLLAPIKRNAEQIKESLYLESKLKGLSDRYAFSRDTTKIEANTGAMFAAKYDMDVKKFAYQQYKDQQDFQMDMAKDGLKFQTDGLGHTTIVQDPLSRQSRESSIANGGKANPNYSDLYGYSAAAEGSKNQVDKESIDKRKTELMNANDNLLNNFVKQMGWLKNDPNITITDLMQNGHLAVNMSDEDRKALQYMQQALEASTRGLKFNYDKIDPGFKDVFAKYQENLAEIKGYDQYLSNIDKQVANSYAIDDSDRDKLLKYSEIKTQLNNLDKKYPLLVDQGIKMPGSSSSPYRPDQAKYDEEAKTLDAQLNSLGVTKDARLTEYLKNKDSERNKLIATQSEIFQMPFTKASDNKDKDLAKILAANVTDANLHAYNADGTVNEKLSNKISFDNIETQTKGYKTINGKLTPVINIKYKTGSDADEFEIASIPLDSDQASKLGFGTEVKPYSGYDMALKMTGIVPDLKTTSGKVYNLRYDVKKFNPADPNDQRVFLRIYNKYGTPMILNSPQLLRDSPEQAVFFAEQLANYKSYDEVVEFIDKNANNK